ncbi:hypothetical protein J2TS6_45320 [Paenibacillus albilobatus]|uniref:Uncharacterized protein n=1 Tax=Paenibacillus albilobatus TaxID=2716884 RepID=A0A919XJK7_9BACL|nr:hypothetical protein J2TS6_45320 [Paenibacillus albilobatus]
MHSFREPEYERRIVFIMINDNNQAAGAFLTAFLNWPVCSIVAEKGRPKAAALNVTTLSHNPARLSSKTCDNTR